MEGKHVARWIFLSLAVIVTAGCTAVGRAIHEGLPASRGEMQEVAASIEDAAEGGASGNFPLFGAGALGVIGVGALIARRLIRRELETYDDAPFSGPSGEHLTEAELVARVQALPSPKS